MAIPTKPAAPAGCGQLHTSMLSWQNCKLCRDLPMYEAYKRSPRFVEPSPPNQTPGLEPALSEEQIQELLAKRQPKEPT